MTKVIFYHAGCPVCTEAERTLLPALNRQQYQVEVVHLGERKERLDEAERVGVRSVPALVIGNTVLHINFGASLEELKR